MKFKTTRKALSNYYSNIYQIGYCELYPLYQSYEAKAYTCGVYGWNYDVYEIDMNTCVTSGYRGMFGAEIPQAAQRILDNAKKYCSVAAGHSYEQREKYLKNARRKFELALINK